MISLEEFARTLSINIKQHLLDAKKCIGKEVVDSEALKKGIVMDFIKDYYGIKVSLLGYKYRTEETERIEKFKQDVLVCVGRHGRFFISLDEVKAVGSVILLDKKLDLPEIKEIEKRRNEIMKKY